MSENPFKIIRPADRPPETLRKDVMGSVRLMMLMMRFMQLFVADWSATVFENVRVLKPVRDTNDPEQPTDP
ncbi:MAG: hypothetical protein KDB88_06360 [Flavobacteriales bacterium]|nr:hypothetical protein [Flavobacteriales bacterium]